MEIEELVLVKKLHSFLCWAFSIFLIALSVIFYDT